MRQRLSFILLVILFCAVIFASGCETTKGIATGVCATAEGMSKDAKGTWDTLIHADEWMRKNLW